MSELIEPVMMIAEQAADKIMAVYAGNFQVESKADKSPLTKADLASHKHILDALAKLTPAIPVLSEESAGVPYCVRRTWRQYWLVDPLDGTREFVKRNGEFTINIALIRDNSPVLGVIYIPVQQSCYYASKGGGAFRREKQSKPVRISTKSTKDGAFIVAGSRSHGNQKQTAFFHNLGDNTEVLAVGSALKFCLVAQGAADIYPRFGPTSEWDTAAGQCIVEEAGGAVTDMAFSRLTYNTKDSLLNPAFLAIADPQFDWKTYL